MQPAGYFMTAAFLILSITIAATGTRIADAMGRQCQQGLSQ